MAKHKKTRQQKIVAELRRKLQIQNQTYAFSPSQTPEQPKKKHAYVLRTTPNVTAYPYIKHDLLKTFILTGTVIIFELILFFLTKYNILRI